MTVPENDLPTCWLCKRQAVTWRTVYKEGVSGISLEGWCRACRDVNGGTGFEETWLSMEEALIFEVMRS